MDKQILHTGLHTFLIKWYLGDLFLSHLFEDYKK